MNADFKQLVDAWARAWSSHDLDSLLALFIDDCIYEDMAFGIANRGKAELRTFAEGNFAAFPDFKIELNTCFIAGDRAGWEWTMSGTHRGDLLGMTPTNKGFSIRGASIAELQADKIKRLADYWDSSALFRQLGLSPATS